MLKNQNGTPSIWMLIIVFSIIFLMLNIIIPPSSMAELYSSIFGYIVDAETRQPISGVEVIAVKKYVAKPNIVNTTSNSKGEFTLKNITVGTYILYLKQIKSYYFENKSKEVTVSAGKNVVGVNFFLKKTGTVSGKVYKGDGSTPYANVGVVAQTPGDYILTGVTDENGYYKIEGIPQTQNAYVSVLAIGVVSISQGNIQIIGGQTTQNVNFIITKDPSSLSVKGIALSSTTQSPIAKGTVLITGENSVAVTNLNSDGSFEAYGLRTGKYNIMVVADNYETAIEKDIGIYQGATITVNFSMKHKESGNSFTRLLRLYAIKFRFRLIDYVYAQETCWSGDCNGLLTDYKTYRGKHLNDVYEPFATSLVCVVDDLCNKVNNNNFTDGKWVVNIMNCVHEPWGAKNSECWKSADATCNQLGMTFNVKYESKLGCYLAQLLCHWGEDLWGCFAYKYGWGSGGDLTSVWHSVGKCVPSFIKSLLN